MRTLWALLVVIAGVSMTGCAALGPGQSPAQLEAQYNSSGYVSSNFPTMNVDAP